MMPYHGRARNAHSDHAAARLAAVDAANAAWFSAAPADTPPPAPTIELRNGTVLQAHAHVSLGSAASINLRMAVDDYGHEHFYDAPGTQFAGGAGDVDDGNACVATYFPTSDAAHARSAQVLAKYDSANCHTAQFLNRADDGTKLTRGKALRGGDKDAWRAANDNELRRLVTERNTMHGVRYADIPTAARRNILR